MSSHTVAPELDSKSPSNRLLDLLAGWAAFVGSEEENQIRDAGLSAEELGELYQAAGAESLAWDQLSLEEQERAVRRFVEERLVSLLLRRTPSAQKHSRAA